MKPVGIHLLHPLQTRSWKHAYIYIYIHIYVPRKNTTCISVWVHALTSLVAHILVCDAFTCGQVLRPRLPPAKHWWSPCLTTEKKRLSAFTRSFALPPLNSTSDTACDAHDNACGTNLTSTWCKLLSTYTFKSNRPCTSYIVFSPLVVSDGHCQKAKNRPTPLV
jgi:hypothetical protein